MIQDRWDAATILNKRTKIAENMKAKTGKGFKEMLQHFSSQEMVLLWKFYDEEFLSGWFSKNFTGEIQFLFSRRLTKSAGITKCPRDISHSFNQKLHIQMIFSLNFFKPEHWSNKKHDVCGILTHNAFEALQIVFEHECCHAIEFIHAGKSSCKKKPFKQLAFQVFGHTKSFHQLPIVREMYANPKGIRKGDKVLFKRKGIHTVGVVNSIQKGATVMVETIGGVYRDRYGRRYDKFWVPLEKIMRTKD